MVAALGALPATGQAAAKARPTLHSDPYGKALTEPLCRINAPAFRNTL